MLTTRTLRYPLLAALVVWLAPAVAAWTPHSQKAIAKEAARLVPPDLYRQLARHRAAYLQGVGDPFSDREPSYHAKNPDGSGQLEEAIARSVENAMRAIHTHQPFQEISYRCGIVSHYLADANNPLNAAQSDPQEGRYYADYLRYLESVEPRVKVVFYGFRSGFEGRRDLPRLVAETLERSRGLYPMVGREYQRVGFRASRDAFDDRSTAYAVAALAYSHAVSDIAEVLRYIWLEAGGIDTRSRLPLRGQDVVHLPRGTTPR